MEWDRGESWMFWRDCVCQMCCSSCCGCMKPWQCGLQKRRMKAKTDRSFDLHHFLSACFSVAVEMLKEEIVFSLFSPKLPQWFNNIQVRWFVWPEQMLKFILVLQLFGCMIMTPSFCISALVFVIQFFVITAFGETVALWSSLWLVLVKTGSSRWILRLLSFVQQ